MLRLEIFVQIMVCYIQKFDDTKSDEFINPFSTLFLSIERFPFLYCQIGKKSLTFFFKTVTQAYYGF